MRLAIVMLLVVIDVAAAAERTQNAALLYWRAFDLLPASNDFEPDPIMEAAGAATFMLDEATLLALEKVEPALDLLVRATMLPECDWGVDFDGEDAMSPLTHPESAHRLAAFAILQARLSAAGGEHKQAIALLRGAVALVRRAAVNTGMLGAPIQLEVERLAVNAAFEMAPRTPPSLRPRLDLLDHDLPPRVTPPQWWEDVGSLARWARKIAATGDITPFEKWMQEVGYLPDGYGALPEREKLNSKKLTAMLDELEAEYAKVQMLFTLPEAEFAIEYKKWFTKVNRGTEANVLLLFVPGSADRFVTMDHQVAEKLKSLRTLATP